MADSLESGEIQAEPLFPGDDFDPRKYAKQIRGRAGELGTCLDRIPDLQRDAEAALLHKREVTDEYDSLFGNGARTFESYCRMAGKTKLADRVRPSASRPGRTQLPPGEAESAAEDSTAQENAAQENAAEESTAAKSTAPEPAAQESVAGDSVPAGLDERRPEDSNAA